MADTGRPDDGPEDAHSLEMPAFSLRRKRQAPERSPEPDPEPTGVLPRQPAERPDGEQPATAVPAVEAREETDADSSDREPRRRRELPLSGLPAAALTGVVIGGLAVLLASLATTGCEAVRGTPSCGGGPGLLILIAVLVLLAYAGGWLLRLFALPDPGSTSILAVGIMAVLVMVFLLGSTDAWWMVIAMPVVTVIAFCASWWVTTAVMDDDAGADAPEPHDVR